MTVGYVVFSLALGLRLISGTPLKGPPKSVSLPLHRHVPLYESEDAQASLPLKVSDIESLVYTIDVQVGSPPQRFNMTLDSNADAPVLFAKGLVAWNRSCSTGDDRHRNLFDRSLSKTFEARNDLADLGGYELDAYPYVGLECQKSLDDAMFLDGVWAWDTYQFGALTVPNVFFVLANQTSPERLNPRWASDGVFPLSMCDALDTILAAFGGAQEVSLFLNNAKPSDNQPLPGGRITFGSKNTQDCGDKWVTLQSDVYGGLSLNSMSGNYTLLSTSSPFLQVPRWYIRPLVYFLGGTFNEDLDLYTVDCGKVHSLPPMRISLGSGFGITYNVKAQDYVAKINGKNGVQCALLIVQLYDYWVLGTQFLPRRCVHLDYANNRIGFADPKN